MPTPKRVVAIGLDAADGRLVRRLMAEGRMPALARLAAAGRWGTVTSPAPIGSGAVWPTFFTGLDPDRHGLFGEFNWHADRMTLERPSFAHLVPFWSHLAQEGGRATVLDVPFAPVIGHDNLVEVADWGAHDWLGGRRVVRPPPVEASLADLLVTPHPLSAGPVDSAGPGDVEGLRHVVRSCTTGARMRGDLAIRLLDAAPADLLLAVFGEAHRASHLLWHTIDADHPAWREGIGVLPVDLRNGLLDVFAAIDEQIGRIVSHAGDEASVIVFALHGMQPARGIPAFLGDVLERWGFATRRGWSERSMREHAGALAAAAKRRLPGALKAAYYRRVPKSVTLQLAQPSMPVPPWDWSRTKAFSLPTDQHGWIRLNLAGREAQGVVPADRYESTCGELRDRLLRLSSAEGLLVHDVLLTADQAGGPPVHLPDLVVHWSRLTCRARLRLTSPPLDSPPIGLKFVSQHDHDGFFVAAGVGTEQWPETIEAADLGRAIAHAVRPRVAVRPT